MRKKRKNPATGGNRRGVDSFFDASRPYFPPEPDERKVFFLSVDADGRENSFDQKPDHVLSLEVEVIGDWEITETRSVWNWSGATLHIKSVRPPGAGWEISNNESDRHTVWRRRVSKAVR